MIKSSSEPALRAGSEGGGNFKIFLGGGFREFSILGGFFWNTPPLAIPDLHIPLMILNSIFSNSLRSRCGIFLPSSLKSEIEVNDFIGMF